MRTVPTGNSFAVTGGQAEQVVTGGGAPLCRVAHLLIAGGDGLP